MPTPRPTAGPASATHASRLAKRVWALVAGHCADGDRLRRRAIPHRLRGRRTCHANDLSGLVALLPDAGGELGAGAGPIVEGERGGRRGARRLRGGRRARAKREDRE